VEPCPASKGVDEPDRPVEEKKQEDEEEKKVDSVEARKLGEKISSKNEDDKMASATKPAFGVDAF